MCSWNETGLVAVNTQGSSSIETKYTRGLLGICIQSMLPYFPGPGQHIASGGVLKVGPFLCLNRITEVCGVHCKSLILPVEKHTYLPQGWGKLSGMQRGRLTRKRGRLWHVGLEATQPLQSLSHRVKNISSKAVACQPIHANSRPRTRRE